MANSRLCSIPHCGKPHKARGFCVPHYNRLCTHGDPLGGRTTRDELLHFIKEVAIRHSSPDCLTWPYAKDAHGYGKISVDGKMVLAHRYVCELAHGAPPTPEHEAAHSCGKGHDACIAPGHLDWKTHAENEADKLGHGTHNRGERCGSAKLTETDVREIICMKGVESQRNLANRFGVTPGTVAKIHLGMRWGWLTEIPNPSPNVVIE